MNVKKKTDEAEINGATGIKMGMHAYEKRQSTTTKTETDELIRQKKIYKLKIVWFWLLRLR